MSPDVTLSAQPTIRSSIPVLLPYPFYYPFEYLYNPAQYPSLKPGHIVRIPLGKRSEVGVVWPDTILLPPDLALPACPPFSEKKLKPIHALSTLPPLPLALCQFIAWVAAYTLAPLGSVLAMSLRALPSKLSQPTVKGWALNTPLPTQKLTPHRQKIYDILTHHHPLTTSELAQKADVKPAIIRAMAKAGLLVEKKMPPPRIFQEPIPTHNLPLLSSAQQQAVNVLQAKIRAGTFNVTLLEGVTGSGKTEIYFEAIAEALKQNKQILVLLPEIALSAQWVERFVKRFDVKPALWHSELTPNQRKQTWLAVRTGEAKVVVGARSALFLPFNELGLIIVDEEHETTYKQEEGVTYHARDMAILRGRLSNAPVILVSATPSIETYVNAQSGKYEHLVLPERHGTAQLPHTSIIDMRQHPPPRGLFLSPPLIEAIKEVTDKNQQAMLFLNRRGYAPLTLCRACGHRIQCPHCTAWLVEHKNPPVLSCHHCDHQQPIPSSCPSCGAEHSLAPIGPGIERIAEEARMLFPQLRTALMASDTLSTPSRTTQMIESITKGEIDLIIGTQTVAKGWHFPNLTCVGIVDADLGLGGGDLRAAERSMQLLHQVSGRAGRADFLGKVLIQSYMPAHPVIQALKAGDFEAFLKQETALREPGFWPPFGRLAALIISSENEARANEIALQLAKTAPLHLEHIQVLGPAPAPIAILRNQHRRRMLLRSIKSIALQPILRYWLSLIPADMRKDIDIDIDPVSFL